MSWSGVIIWNSIIFICSLDQVEHGLKFPDYNHIVVNPYKIFATIVLFFLFNSFIVLIYRNFTEFNKLWFSDNFRIDVLTFWHGFMVLLSCGLAVFYFYLITFVFCLLSFVICINTGRLLSVL